MLQKRLTPMIFCCEYQGESSMMAFLGLSGRGRRLTAEGPPDQPGIFYRSLDRLFASRQFEEIDFLLGP